MITETTLFKHHYRAIHQDGSVETLFDSRYVDELGRFIDSGNESDNVNATEVDVWFEGPLVFPYSEEEPMIKKWEVQDLTNNKYLRNFEYGDMIWEEQELVFWVYVYDPDRSSDYYRRPLCYADDSPTLILTNYGDSTEIFVYSDFTWAEYNHDLQADKFWVQIGAGEIGAGLWNFEFTINDTQSNSFVMPEEKLPRIWIVGSVNEIFRERTTSMNFFGFLPTTLFILFAGLARSSSNFYVQIAATVATFVTVIISTGFIINEVYNLCARKNTGGLIGLGLALLTITLCTSLSLGHSGGSSSIGSIGFQTSNIGYFFMSIFSLIGGLIFAFTDLGSIMYELFFAFSDVFFFISLSMVLGMTINSITQPGGKNFDASKWIKNILIAYSLIIALIGLICFIAANIKNGAYTVME
jgi:hypothetical protein